ncbi:geranylgeranyl reductase family protein [Lentzea flaviverrucosa]|uniref:Geranylgeranyl reductase family n=1 Tax=Lentzea flaviverrucosa TaxID=200379 RepID=A0A1H9C6B0_9PSEU|nr:NAD(P)/FAD-dependent oxidoreductase [Lentzea flaviverrucosa]RDI24463.1 geranylgeranyl reductase family protein [Lentzea flaviverrucosa]SEP96815.1 geranylgeranyl reductase family [Lentzea flaviverrucosa]
MTGYERWDLVVVGAGPAGSTAALAALRVNPAARVLVLDAAEFPRDKVCGDGVAPHALDVLTGLGVDVGALTAGTAPIRDLRLTSPRGVTAVRRFARPAAVVPRALLDARLVAAARTAGAELRRHRIRSLTPTEEGVDVDGAFHARTVIGADGAESVVRRQCGARSAKAGTTAIALRGYTSAGPWPAAEQRLVMSTTHWPAYAWVFPVGDGTANVGYGELIRQKPPTRTHLTERLHALLPDCPPLTLRGHRLPLSPGRPDVGRGRVLLVGDAASLINPLTGEGIYYAVLSGSLAGAAAMTPDPAGEYRRSLHRLLGKHLRHTDALAMLTRMPALVDLATSAARDGQRAFDDLVEVGLGPGTISPALVTAMLRTSIGSALEHSRSLRE